MIPANLGRTFDITTVVKLSMPLDTRAPHGLAEDHVARMAMKQAELMPVLYNGCFSFRQADGALGLHMLSRTTSKRELNQNILSPGMH